MQIGIGQPGSPGAIAVQPTNADTPGWASEAPLASGRRCLAAELGPDGRICAIAGVSDPPGSPGDGAVMPTSKPGAKGRG